MTATLNYTGTLTVTVCWCGMKHAIPEELYRTAQRQHADGHDSWIYCPQGHKWAIAGESAAAKLQREKDQLTARLARADQRQAELKTSLEAAHRQTAAQKAVATKIRKRAAKGVCPCCNRFFAELSRHIKTDHPEVFNEK